MMGWEGRKRLGVLGDMVQGMERRRERLSARLKRSRGKDIFARTAIYLMSKGSLREFLSAGNAGLGLLGWHTFQREM